MLLRAVQSMLAAHETSGVRIPVVLCGDFNSLAVKHVADGFDIVPSFPPGGEPSGPYVLITTGVLPSTHQEHPHQRRSAVGLGDLVSPLPPLSSAYVAVHGCEPVITTKVADFDGTIDFIFTRWVAGREDPTACTRLCWGR